MAVVTSAADASAGNVTTAPPGSSIRTPPGEEPAADISTGMNSGRRSFSNRLRQA
jgi:hypothetical protein